MDKPETVPKGQFLFVVPNILCDQIVEEGNICLKTSAWTILVLPTMKTKAEKIWDHFELCYNHSAMSEYSASSSRPSPARELNKCN